jgi:hypothetical protein
VNKGFLYTRPKVGLHKQLTHLCREARNRREAVVDAFTNVPNSLRVDISHKERKLSQSMRQLVKCRECFVLCRTLHSTKTHKSSEAVEN